MSTTNTLKTVALLAALTALFLFVGNALGGQAGMVFAFGLAVLMNGGAYWFSDRIALRMAGAREVSYSQAPELHRIVEQLSSYAHLPKPRVYVIDNPSPNAFATGRSPEHAAVAVTTGILHILNRDELAAVLAHELAHIRNRDTLIATVVATVVGAISMIAHMAQWALIFGGFGRGEDEEGGGLGSLAAGLIMIILAPLIATIIQLAISRSREFEADATGARIIGQPGSLASALQKLEAASRVRPMAAEPAVAPLYIVNPLNGRALSGLFSTHPPISERVARLRAMAGQIWSYGLDG